MMNPCKWGLCSLLVLLFCDHLVHAEYYEQLHNRRWGNRARPTTSVPRVSGSSPGRGISRGPDDASRGRYYSRLFTRVLGNRGLRRKGVTPSRVLSSTSTSFSEIPVPPEIAAMIPQGGTIDDIPKSQLAVLTGDPEYTRFRQLFLRDLCRRLLNGPRSHSFQFCFSILAL
ncbi:uncharacterized protein LOC143294012 [Babylonia areolata]|uniref:uncharacterized protein LOC143294012 n=1 Tax=Babylonia areolata TaxID=304850 RepID=UPI003FCF6762